MDVVKTNQFDDFAMATNEKEPVMQQIIRPHERILHLEIYPPRAKILVYNTPS